MDIVHQKSLQFIHRLLANPALHDLSPVKKEEQIAQFLKANGPQLYPTLSSPNFFPGYNWAQIESLLMESLTELINQTLFTQLQNLIDSIDFGFIAFLREQALPINSAPQAVLNFQKQLLKKNEARRALDGPFMAIQASLPNRYVEEAFRRREYIYFELVKVQKLRMSKEEIKNLIKTSLLLKNAIHVLSIGVGGHEQASGVVQKQFADKVLQTLKGQLKLLPEALLKSGLNSNISFLENPGMETTSRLAAIFAFRCQDYKPIAKVDRGAVSPDKSWFNIARRNYKFYGFDIKMLDELYKIAGENGW
jgi:hypothetical protein